MVVFPNCKINLGLHITAKREDGYHDLETLFYPLPLCDALEVVSSESLVVSEEEGAGGRESIIGYQLPVTGNEVGQDKQLTTGNRQQATNLQFTSTGLPIGGDVDKNLCVKAYYLLKKDFPLLPSIQMHLHKVIPMGAGLGGGSADGTFTLQLLNSYFQLKISDEQLIDYALQLGSDCPFFVINKPSFAKGRGEALEPVDVHLSDYKFVVIHPGIHVNTGWAFSQLTPKAPEVALKDVIASPVDTWRNQLINDFEAPVFKAHPVLAEIKQQLYKAGSVYASMSGSGSSLFGIFEKSRKVELNLPKEYFYWEEK